MLGRCWIGRYLPPIVTDHVSDAPIVGWGNAWAALMLSFGVAFMDAARAFVSHSVRW